jgi:hypothetical protein
MLYSTYRKPRKLSKKLLEETLTFAQDYLDLPYNTYVNIEYLSQESELHFGFCMDMDKKELEYSIEINRNTSIEQMTATLFHELVHVKQYIDGRLVSGEGRSPATWFGIPIYEEYDNQPWEVEAYALEKEMVKEFMFERRIPIGH